MFFMNSDGRGFGVALFQAAAVIVGSFLGIILLSPEGPVKTYQRQPIVFKFAD
jgi:hypothetical protein